METPKPIGVAMVGYGYWSPKLIRNIEASPDLVLKAICEKDESRHAAIRNAHPNVRIYRHYRDAFADESIDAAVIATIPSSHYRIAKLALEKGKHVLVEKPLALSVEEGEILVSLAKAQNRVLMVDHTYLYSPAVERLLSVVRDGELGSLYSIESTRTNLGLFQRDTNVVWDLAPHDFSILLRLTDERPEFVTAIGSKTVVHPKQKRAQESAAHLLLSYKSGLSAHIYVSWISPVKVRQFTVVGSERMAMYDQLADEPVQLFDQGVYPNEDDGESGPLFMYKVGPTTPLHTSAAGEDLGSMLADFVHAVRTGEPPRSSALLGLEVVRLLSASERSLRNGGMRTRIHYGKGNALKAGLLRLRPR